MIIKLQHAYGHNMWQIIENATGVSFAEGGRYTSPARHMEEPKNEGDVYSVQHSRPNPEELSWFNYLEYSYAEHRFHILFDGKAYICNDDGKTIHSFHQICGDVYYKDPPEEKWGDGECIPPSNKVYKR